MKKKEILLPTKRFFKADEEDVTLNVKLDNNETLMREGERNIIFQLYLMMKEIFQKHIRFTER